MGKQRDTQVVTIKSIDEHPRVVELLKEIERLKSDKPGGIGAWQKAVKERDDHLAAEQVRLQSEICALQDRCSRLLGWALEIRAAANKPMPRD